MTPLAHTHIHGTTRPARWITQLCVAACFALPSATGIAHAKGPARDVLGIRPGMSEEEAHRRLERFGRMSQAEEEAEGRQEGNREMWTLQHPRFTYVVLVFDRQERVQYVQGYLHKDHRPLRYADIGDLRKAKQTGYYIYVWDVPARGDQPSLEVQARGSDSRFPGSYLVARRPGPDRTEPHAGKQDPDRAP